MIKIKGVDDPKKTRVFEVGLVNVGGEIILQIRDDVANFDWAVVKIVEEGGKIRLDRISGISRQAFHIKGETTVVEVR